jgi:tetratricopeptide (TPR) repeat protein
MALEHTTTIKQAGVGRFRLWVTTREQPLDAERWRRRFTRPGLGGWTRLGAAHVGRGDWPAAVAALGKAAAVPGGATATDHFLLAVALGRLNQTAEANKAYDQAVTWLGKNPLYLDEPLRQLAVEAAGARIWREPTNALVWQQRARWHAQLGQQSEAVADLTRALGFNPKLVLAAEDATVLTWRGDQAARRGEWEGAAADLARAVTVPGAPAETWRLHALLRLQRDDLDGYKKACAALAGGPWDDAGATDAVLRSCVLTADALPDPSALVPLAEKGVKQPPTARQLAALGAVLYRAGKFEEAARRLADATGPGRAGGEAVDWLFLAMAHHRLGHGDEAKQWLARAARWLDQAPRAGTPPPWTLLLEARVLKREAEALLTGGTP